MNKLDISDLPEPVARALESMVERLREQFAEKRQSRDKQVRPLKTRPGTVKGPITREVIYGNGR